jgi:hypothetical protein
MDCLNIMTLPIRGWGHTNRFRQKLKKAVRDEQLFMSANFKV